MAAVSGISSDKLVEQVIAILRKDNKALESKNRSLLSQVAKLENSMLDFDQRARNAERVREALYDAVRVLAEQIENKEAPERRARERARSLLESAGIIPPGTLGSSRARKKKRKRRKS